MSHAADFVAALEAKIAEQLKAQRVGYLLGAGSSHLNGSGYALALQLWDRIKDRVTDKTKREEIQAKLDSGAQGIEEALDLLDNGQAVEGPHRHLVTAAIAELFQPLNPSLDQHIDFVKRLSPDTRLRPHQTWSQQDRQGRCGLDPRIRRVIQTGPMGAAIACDAAIVRAADCACRHRQ